MVILGVLVGGLVIAMYLPIFKLGAVRLTPTEAVYGVPLASPGVRPPPWRAGLEAF
jgi:hypothetical protein